jgi:hypothetical protein
MAAVETKDILVCLFLASATTGCIGQLPPPPTPAKIAPAIADPPTAPPGEGHGRVVLDAVGEEANVSRVTETIVPPYVGAPTLNTDRRAPPSRSQELLCVTPCIVDIRQGAHTFVFTAKDDPTRTSDAEVVVTSKVTNVRHAIGREYRLNPQYAGGWMMAFAGSGLTTMGLLVSAVGLVAEEPRPGPDGRTEGASPSSILATGLVLLGLGLAVGIPGIVMAHNNRPQAQPGSTVTWFQ